MKMLIAPAIATALLMTTQSAKAQNVVKPAAMEESEPLACNRLALTPEQRKRHFDELGPALRARKTAVRELPDGYEFQFPSDAKTFQLLTEWIDGERVCCPFFEIALRLEPQSGPVWMRLTGKNGVKEFMEVEGASWLK